MRVLAINDISCVGKCSLTAALPILSACGVECTPLPTALLSTHTGGFEGYTFRDLTKDIPAMLAHWNTLGLKFDYIYSGYLGSLEQIDLVLTCKKELLKEGGKLIVDPVMGDSGKLYAGFTEEYVEKMRGLCKQADYILPNETEACYLAGLPYPLTKESAPKAVKILATLCPRPVLTGVTEGERIFVYSMEEERMHACAHENVHGFFCGAGDVFASAFVGCIANGKTQTESVELASSFAAACIRRSAKEVPDKRFGLPFEKEIFSFLKIFHDESLTSK